MNNTLIDWNAVRAFAAIARAGTLTGAARALGTSQPTLGRHLEALERQLGATLFVRGRGGMAPTEAGLALLERAEAMEREADALLRMATGQRNKPIGDVRVTASRVVATYLLPPLVVGLARSDPGIVLDIVASDEVANLLARDADLAIRMVRPTQGDVIASKLGELTLGAFAAPVYIERHGVPDPTPEGLLSARLVGYDRSTLILDGLREAGVKAGRDIFAVRTDDQVLYHRLVVEGAGIGFLPEVIADGLVPIPLPTAPPSMAVWLAAHRDLRTSAAVRRVADAIKRELPGLKRS